MFELLRTTLTLYVKKCAEPISGHQTERLYAHLHGELRPNGHVQQHIRAHSFQVRSTKVLNVVFALNKHYIFVQPFSNVLELPGDSDRVGSSHSCQPNDVWGRCDGHYSGGYFFLNIFWRTRVCWPFLCLCRTFCIFDFERCLESNTKNWRSKGKRPT